MSIKNALLAKISNGIFILAHVMFILAIGSQCARAGQTDLPPVGIEFFFEPGCNECARVREEVLPLLQEAYAGFYFLEERDIGIEEHYLRLAHYQNAMGIEQNEPVSMVLEGRYFLNGFSSIHENLLPLLDQLIAEKLAGSQPASQNTEKKSSEEDDHSILIQRVRSFTFAGVIAAGLVDGINPCAISTLVFFISLLSVMKVTGKRLLLVGTAFCTASFITYTAIGFGLFRALHLFSGFAFLQAAINAFMIILLGIFAFISFRDAYRYRKNKDARDVSLQLPHSIKMKIHRIMRGGIGKRSLLFGSLFIGASVTALESVCTGQVYLPTLILVIKSGGGDLASLGYLILYNIMFMVPIVTVFILTLQGLKTTSLIAWSKRNVVTSKMLLGFFFVAMAALIMFIEKIR